MKRAQHGNQAQPRRLHMGTQTRGKVGISGVVCADTGKRCYPSHGEAWLAAERAMDRGEVKPMHHQTPYKCQDCGFYHHGNMRVYFRVDE